MAKVIYVDFSKRGKDLFYLQKQRKQEKKWQNRLERIERAIENSYASKK